MQKKKVLIIFFGNIHFDSRCSKIINTLLKYNYQVELFEVLRKDEKIDLNNLPPGLKITPIFLNYKNKTPFLKYYFKTFFKILFRKADIYFSSDLYSMPLAYFASLLNRKQLYYDSRELYSHIAALKDKKLKQKIWVILEKFTIKRCSKVFTVNESISDIISKTYSIEKPLILYNVPNKRQNLSKVDLYAEFSIPKDHKILLSQGGLQSGRGIPILLDIIARIDGCVCLFLGRGPFRSNIMNHPLFGRKVFLSETVGVSNLLDYTSGAYIGISLIENYGLSYYYSLPNKFFEYCHAGIPIIASNFPEMAKIIKEYKIGEICEPTNKNEIIDKIMMLINNPEIYSLYKNNCTQAAEYFTWEIQEKKLLNAFK
jgi:glycosyltransferase involved in cell wall biosynthesis